MEGGNNTISLCLVVVVAFSLVMHISSVYAKLHINQVDSSYAYAYTLLGHEYIYNEDFAKAMSCFRSAIRCDARHYNAWYGSVKFFVLI